MATTSTRRSNKISITLDEKVMGSLEAVAETGFYNGQAAEIAKAILHAAIPTLQVLVEKRGDAAIMDFVCNLGALGNPHNSAFGKLEGYEAVSEEAMTEIVESLERVAGEAAWYRGRQSRALLVRTSRPRLVEPQPAT
jgi:hypothetical protein